MSEYTGPATFFVPHGDEKPECPRVVASAICGKTVQVFWKVVTDYTRSTIMVPADYDEETGLSSDEEVEEVIWLPVFGATLAESEKMDRDDWAPGEHLADYATRVLGPKPDLPT